VNKILKKSVFFIIPVVVFTLFGIFYFSLLNKGDAVIWLNEQHSPFGDIFFKLATFLGDGIFTALVIIALLLYRPYWFIQLLTAVLSNAVVIYILKRHVFNFNRPLRVLSDIKPNLVEGVKIHEIYSFPSGHTNSAFVLGLVLTLLVKDKKWGIFFFLIALSTAISRMYLFQHFFMDVYAGALIGVFISLLTFYWIDKSDLKNRYRLQKSFIKF
jgi:membrane-associated phospholipid phosphatase